MSGGGPPGAPLASAHLAAAQPGLHPAWRRWLADNLLLGAPAQELLDTLMSQGVSPAFAEAELSQLMDHPLLDAARDRIARLSALHGLVEAHAPEALERRAAPSHDFLYQHVLSSRPARFDGVAEGWPALGWTFAALASRFAGVEVQVWDARGAPPADGIRREASFTAMPFEELVALCLGPPRDDVYLISRNRALSGPLSSLVEELTPLRPPLDAARVAGNARLWMGPAGSHTRLHHDRTHIVFVQLVGRKCLWMASPASLPLLDEVDGVYSPLDLRAGVEGVRVHALELGPGDAVFIPAGWWHQVEALSPSISASFTNLLGLRVNHFPGYRLG